MKSTFTGRQYKAIVDDSDVSDFDKSEMAMPIKNNFEYDPFQKRSMKRIFENNHVFVSVPTSSGKTVVASYAIGLSLQHKKKAIYTSPIKSLSNQKFQEFTEDFGKVGILTGDTTINRKAPVLIMTTEILQSMLYKNDPILKNVEVVIFDEFHYLANQQRGIVWEESVIRMPDNINMVFLSASMPNAMEIASWISKTKKRNVYIEMHKKRPVPLNHYIYIDDQLFKISDQKKDCQTFDKNAYQRAKLHKVPKRNELRTKSYLINLVHKLVSSNLLPALMFEFSINIIEEKADTLLGCSGVNLVTNKEKYEIDKFLSEKVLKRIDQHDLNLKQIQKMIKLLRVGIGIHHSGILPIFKETVEILLNKGLIKFVFCTSTIGMGLNLPVKTCIFANMTKYDGNGYVDLTMTEYQQMSGRAGRRGKDDFGTSIICPSGIFPKEQYLRDICCGDPDEIKSQFQINFKMVINSFCELSGMEIHEVMRKSFYECSSNSTLSDLNKKIEKNKDMLSQIPKIDCPHNEINNTEKDIEDIQLSPIHSYVQNNEKMININSKIITNYKDEFEGSLKIGMIVLFIDHSILLMGIIDSINTNDDDEIESVSLLFSNGEQFTVTKDYFANMNILAIPIDINTSEMSREDKLMIIQHYDPKERLNKYDEFMNIDDEEFKKLANSHHQFLSDIIYSPCYKCDSFKNHFKESFTTNVILKNIKNDESKLKNEERKEYGKYLNMLMDMDYIFEEENGKFSQTEKGKMANDIYGHEIISTEVIHRKFFDDCTLEEMAALCSCLVAQRVGLKNIDIESFSPKIDTKVYKMRELIKDIKSKMRGNAIPFEDDFLDLNMNTKTMKLVYKWANGESFSNVMYYADTILEGQIASVITKVVSMLNNFSDVAKSIDNEVLAKKFEGASKKLQRGIVFAKSLYLYLD